MKPLTTFIISGLIAVTAAYVTVQTIKPEQLNSVKSQSINSIYNRVINSGQLNCGYVVYSPYFTKDPNTGQLGGIFYDLTNELGKRLDLKINWSLNQAGEHLQRIFPLVALTPSVREFGRIPPQGAKSAIRHRSFLPVWNLMPELTTRVSTIIFPPLTPLKLKYRLRTGR